MENTKLHQRREKSLVCWIGCDCDNHSGLNKTDICFACSYMKSRSPAWSRGSFHKGHERPKLMALSLSPKLAEQGIKKENKETKSCANSLLGKVLRSSKTTLCLVSTSKNTAAEQYLPAGDYPSFSSVCPANIPLLSWRESGGRRPLALHVIESSRQHHRYGHLSSVQSDL